MYSKQKDGRNWTIVDAKGNLLVSSQDEPVIDLILEELCTKPEQNPLPADSSG